MKYFSNCKLHNFPLIFMFFSLIYAPQAMAYVGPGLGLGVVVTVLGILFGIAALIGGVIWYPIKRLVRRLIKKK